MSTPITSGSLTAPPPRRPTPQGSRRHAYVLRGQASRIKAEPAHDDVCKKCGDVFRQDGQSLTCGCDNTAGY